ncbi:MAG: arsenate reductase (glutaredoxin) [Legionellaceae bacterium]|nr:arsenate reductase (glutaredoxin) [Legionellaceae bacterium]
MNNFVIYHNPRCSKSRETLEILKNKGANIKVIEYLKHPLNFDQLSELGKHFLPEDFVRKNEKNFKDLRLSINDREAIIRAIEEDPKLMQRPIVVCEGRAVIGRPPERVLELF